MKYESSITKQLKVMANVQNFCKQTGQKIFVPDLSMHCGIEDQEHGKKKDEMPTTGIFFLFLHFFFQRTFSSGLTFTIPSGVFQTTLIEV